MGRAGVASTILFGLKNFVYLKQDVVLLRLCFHRRAGLAAIEWTRDTCSSAYVFIGGVAEEDNSATP